MTGCGEREAPLGGLASQAALPAAFAPLVPILRSPHGLFPGHNLPPLTARWLYLFYSVALIYKMPVCTQEIPFSDVLAIPYLLIVKYGV